MSDGYPAIMFLLIAGVIGIPLVYVLARVASAAWYKGKLVYQRRLIAGLTTGEENGKSTKEPG